MRHLSLFSRISLLAAILALFAIGFTGCSDDDDDDNPLEPGPSSTEFTGAFASGGDGGQMSITIPLPSGDLAPTRLAGSALVHDVTATGSLYSEGDTIGLSGTYNEEANSLVLTGSGYTLTGTYDAASSPAGIAGTYTGPNGTGIFGAAVGGNSSVTVLCGTLSDLGMAFTDRWQLIVAGDAVAGMAVMEDGEIIPFEGTLIGAPPGRTLTVNDDLGDGRSMLASGTVYEDAQLSAGTWELDAGTIADPNGTWSAEDCENPPPPPGARSSNE